MRSLGTSVGAAVVGAVLAQMTITMGGHVMASEAGFRISLLIGAGVSLAALMLATLIPRSTTGGPEVVVTTAPAASRV